ncbi:MAG: penicillin-binding transpeptidase domain-containing protein [Clostridium chrysemydis]|uniref:penicillin-binding transpeptidase domain-containing protein n=1 Tax=Clostridium chrysemydis TaxID=2665504 RepID=UPI003F3BBC9D
MKNKKKILGLIITIAIISFVFVGCSAKGKAKDVFESYKDKWIANDYKGMYELLSEESKGRISEEEFIKRYTNIFNGIDAKNMSFETSGDITENNDEFTIPFKGSMDTVAGKLDVNDYKLTVVKDKDSYKIRWYENLIFPQMKDGDKIKVNKLRGNRGEILDRENNALAKDGKLYTVGLHPAKLNPKTIDSDMKQLASILDISEDTITKKLEANKEPDHFVPIVDILVKDPKVDKIIDMKNPGIMLNEKVGRTYINDEAFGRLIGYVGPITKEELDKNKDKGYTETSIIGKAGIEQVYEDTLKAKDGYEILIASGDSNKTLLKTDAVQGKNVKLTIDSNVQKNSYKELKGDKGAATAVNPKTGEVLALVSAPSYNSNMFTTYTTKSQKEELEKTNYAMQENRFNKLYSPGSTMKLITGAIGLNNGVITPSEKMYIKGLNWQKDSSWGGYSVTRVKDPGKPVDLLDAIKYSDNIYMAKVAIGVGADKYIEGAKNFGIGENLDFGYPIEESKISNSGKIDNDILLGDTGYGQGQVMVTPLNIALAYSSLGNNGSIMHPRLIMDDKKPEVWKSDAIKKEYVKPLTEAFEAVVDSPDGTGHAAKIAGHKIAGKTGTAEIKKTQDDKNGTENGWFVAVNTDDSKIAISMMVEDVKNKGGSHYVVPKVKNVMEAYLK